MFTWLLWFFLSGNQIKLCSLNQVQRNFMLEFSPQISLSKFLISFIILKYLKKILSFQLSVLINSLISILRLNSFKTQKYNFFYHCLFFITHSQCSTNEITTFQQEHIALLSAFTIIYTFIQTRVAYLNGVAHDDRLPNKVRLHSRQFLLWSKIIK